MITIQKNISKIKKSKYTKYLFLFTFFCILWFKIVFAQNVDKWNLNLYIRWNWLIIWTPSNLNIGAVSPWSNVEFNFSDYFWVEDLRGTNTGHYTTIQCDWLYWPNWFVITGIQISGNLVDLILWLENQTNIYSNLNLWTDITLPKLYLYRNNDPSTVWIINKYGNKPSIKFYVPQDAPAWSYKGKITYTLYDFPINID